jgi:hypothetical protein
LTPIHPPLVVFSSPSGEIFLAVAAVDRALKESMAGGMNKSFEREVREKEMS